MDKQLCADCNVQVGNDNGPPDGWQLEDGRIVCNSCCVEDLKLYSNALVELAANN